MLRNINIFNSSSALFDCGSNISSKYARSLTSLATSSNGLFTARDNKQKSSPLLQFVRFRKPAWRPIAGTKLHKVNPRIPFPEDDALEMKLRTRYYRTIVKSLRFYFREETEALEKKQRSEREQFLANDSNWDLIEKLNSEWNNGSAELRKKFEEEEIVRKEQEFEELKREVEEAKEAKKAEARRLLEQVKEQRSSFIGAENLDAAIEESLNMRSVFNFFINKEGRRFVENLDGTIVEVDKQGNPVPKSATEQEVEKPFEDETDEEIIEAEVSVSEGDEQKSESDK